jgi:hypothetical protein
LRAFLLIFLGTAIFISRKEGQKILFQFAREARPELSMLYFPKEKVWITQTKSRFDDRLRIDSKYIAAAMNTGLPAEYWHTHNNLTEEFLTSEALHQKAIQWTMPSPTDLVQLWELSHGHDRLKIKFMVVSTLGVTEYWNYDYQWAAALYIRYALRQEAEKLYRDTGTLDPLNLPSFARAHKGFVNLKFTFLP